MRGRERERETERKRERETERKREREKERERDKEKERAHHCLTPSVSCPSLVHVPLSYIAF